jgi:hypothetical protein
MYIKGRKVQRIESRRTKKGRELRFWCSGGRGTMYIAASVSSERGDAGELMAEAERTVFDVATPVKS